MSYNPYYFNESDAEAFGGLLIVLILVGILVGIVAYVITALIYYFTSKTNGFSDLAYISWIPIMNIYILFLLTAKGEDDVSIRAAAKKNTLIYVGIFIISLIPVIGWIASIALVIYSLYYTYVLLYRWSGETGKAVLYLILSLITGGIFYIIYGLLRMKQPFKV